MKKLIVLIISMLFLADTYSQITHSIYTWIGLGTNLGGPIGVGSEIRYKMVSLNCSVELTL